MISMIYYYNYDTQVSTSQTAFHAGLERRELEVCVLEETAGAATQAKEEGDSIRAPSYG